MVVVPIDEIAPFASSTLMDNRSLGAITIASHPFLADELDAATKDIRDFCGWHISPRMQVEYVRRGPDRIDVWLPAMQIASIDEVTIDDTEWDADALATVQFDPSTGWTNLCGRRVSVKYTAGFPEVPANVVTATLELAAQGLGTSLGVTREQAGSVAVTFGRAGGGVENESVLAGRLSAYRIGPLP